MSEKIELKKRLSDVPENEQATRMSCSGLALPKTLLDNKVFYFSKHVHVT